MEVERIFSANQIQVHPDLSKIIREYTKAVIRNNPSDLIEFSHTYFTKLVNEQLLNAENASEENLSSPEGQND